MKLVFSQNSIFHLYRLGQIVSERTGKKYRLSDEKEMSSLIRYCNRSTNTKISRQYDAFLHTLQPEIILEIEKLTGHAYQEVNLRIVS